MDPWIKRIVGCLGVIILHGAGYEFIRFIVTGGVSMIGSFVVPPGLWFGLAGGGIAALVWAGWDVGAKVWARYQAQRHAQLPETRFKALASDISRVKSAFDAEAREIENPLRNSDILVELRTLAYNLEDLDIPCPPTGGKDAYSLWLNFLPYLLACSRAGRLKEARKLYKPRPG